jgi:hypothetical protein
MYYVVDQWVVVCFFYSRLFRASLIMYFVVDMYLLHSVPFLYIHPYMGYIHEQTLHILSLMV